MRSSLGEIKAKTPPDFSTPNLKASGGSRSVLGVLRVTFLPWRAPCRVSVRLPPLLADGRYCRTNPLLLSGKAFAVVFAVACLAVSHIFHGLNYRRRCCCFKNELQEVLTTTTSFCQCLQQHTHLSVSQMYVLLLWRSPKCTCFFFTSLSLRPDSVSQMYAAVSEVSTSVERKNAPEMGRSFRRRICGAGVGYLALGEPLSG